MISRRTGLRETSKQRLPLAAAAAVPHADVLVDHMDGVSSTQRNQGLDRLLRCGHNKPWSVSVARVRHADAGMPGSSELCARGIQARGTSVLLERTAIVRHVGCRSEGRPEWEGAAHIVRTRALLPLVGRPASPSRRTHKRPSLLHPTPHERAIPPDQPIVAPPPRPFRLRQRLPPLVSAAARRRRRLLRVPPPVTAHAQR